MDGDQVNKVTQSCHLSPLSDRSVGEVPIVGPIWRGGIEIRGKFSKKLDGLEVFLPNILHPKVVELKWCLQKSVCFRMKNRRPLWPNHFDDVGAAHSDIELFMFPEVSRSEIDYDDLVEQMISNDLAMTSHIGNFKLIIFTSLEQEDNQQYKQGKYYLWGILKGKGFKRCKSSKGKNTNAETLDCAKKSNSPSSAPSVGHLPTTTRQSAVRYHFVPSLSQKFKRPRSKRGRVPRTLMKEVGDFHKSVVADFPGMERADKEPNGGVPVQWQQTLGKSWQAKICTNIGHVQVANDPDITVMKKKPFMVTDEEDNLSKKDALTSVVDLAEEVTLNTETKEAEQRSWDSNMEIDEPSDSSAINVKETEVELRGWDSDMEIDEPIDDVVKGRCLLGARVDQLECQASDPLPQMDACRTPVLTSEELGPCLSSSSTLVLEVDEEETAMKGTEIFNEGSSIITTTSMLNIGDHFLEQSSDTLRKKVGEYTIKSDLAPILKKILSKYGDIGVDCSMMPETVLEKICKALQDLEQVSLKDLRPRHLEDLRNLCELGEALEIDMKWLYNCCEDLEKTVLQINQYHFLKEELVQCNNSIKSLEENLDLNRSIVDKLLEKNKLFEEKVESLTEHREKLQCEIEDVGLKSRRFTGKSLVDGLF